MRRGGLGIFKGLGTARSSFAVLGLCWHDTYLLRRLRRVGLHRVGCRVKDSRLRVELWILGSC